MGLALVSIILDMTPEEVIGLKAENEELKKHLVDALARISWPEN